MIAMKKILAIFAVAFMCVGMAARAQTAQALEDALHGKPLALKTYSADAVARYTWVDGKLIPGPIDMHGFKFFISDTVRLKGGKLTIEGQSSTLVLNAGKLAPMGKTPMRLEIDLGAADAAKVLPELQADLFFPGIAVALHSLPEQVRDFIPFPADGIYQPRCHCSYIEDDGKWVRLEANDPKLGALGFVNTASDPGLVQKAIDAKVSGSLTLIYLVSSAGRVDEVWIAKPLGSGLDESATKTGRQNIFKPATYEGKPVGAIMMQTLPVN
jgi:hypothetical protein